MNGSIKSRERDAGARRHPGAGAGNGERRRGEHRPDPGRGAGSAAGSGRGERGRGERDGGAPRRISGSVAVEHAKSHLMEFTGQPIEAVSSLNRTRDGWRVVLEVLELERIPRTTDILASYAVELDEHGDLMGYERIHRYYRNDVSGDQ